MKALGIILAGGSSKRTGRLTDRRAVAALPIAGSYRAIDFTLSNMANAHVSKVAVFPQYNARSLNEHLSSSKWWDFGRKQGGLFVFTPMITKDNNFWYQGTADALYQNIDFLRKCHEPYVIIAAGDGVYKLDYAKVLDQHIRKNADITVVYKQMDASEDDLTRFGILKMDENERITEFEEKPLIASSNNVSIGVYIIRRRNLIELLERCAKEDRHDFVRDILIRYKDVRNIFGYKLESYWRNVASVDSYYRTNMDFLKRDVRNYFFKQHPDIYSKVDDLPPAKYNTTADVKNSIVSSGCIINGKVEGSVLFKDVYIGNNCTIRNSIILNDVYIGDDSYIENCIVESHGTIRPGTNYVGYEDEIRVVVEKNVRYIL